MLDKTTYDKVQRTKRKITNLKELRQKTLLEGMKKGKVQGKRELALANMLEKVEEKANYIMQLAERTEKEWINLSDSLKSRGIEEVSIEIMRGEDDNGDGKKTSGLGTLIGKLGSSLVGRADAITKSAVPITTNILKTAHGLTTNVASAAASAAKNITDVAGSTASNLVGTASNVANSLMQNSSNVASSLTSTVSSAIGGILGKGSEVATSTIKNILNP